jgi:hypothetical protein
VISFDSDGSANSGNSAVPLVTLVNPTLEAGVNATNLLTTLLNDDGSPKA